MRNIRIFLVIADFAEQIRAGAADIGVPFGHRADDNRVRDRVRRDDFPVFPAERRENAEAGVHLDENPVARLVDARRGKRADEPRLHLSKSRKTDLHPRAHSGKQTGREYRAERHLGLRFLQIIQPVKQTVDDTRLHLSDCDNIRTQGRDAVVAVALKHHKVGKFVRMGENLVLHQRVDLLDGAVLADVDGVFHENALKAYGQQTKTNR